MINTPVPNTPRFQPDLTPDPKPERSKSDIAITIIGMIIIGLLVLLLSGGFPHGNVGP